MKLWLLLLLVFALVACAPSSSYSKVDIPAMALVGEQDGIRVYRIFDHTNDSGYSLKALCYLAISDKGMDLECP